MTILSIHILALRQFAEKHGRNWKSKLKDHWAAGISGNEQNDHLLRQLRNEYGPVWLDKIDLDTLTAEASEKRLRESKFRYCVYYGPTVPFQNETFTTWADTCAFMKRQLDAGTAIHSVIKEKKDD